MIPRIIHQTWKNDQIPGEWQGFVQSWKKHHPDWEYKLWTNDDGAEFVKRFYPKFASTYFEYPFDIQRADAIRYLVIYHCGGLYVDLDFECLQPFDCLLDTDQLIIGFEPQKHVLEHAQQELLCNALFASKPGSPFLKAVIDYLTVTDIKSFAHEVLETTGPMMLQKVYEHTEKKSVDAHPPSRFYPFVYNAPELLQLAGNSQESTRMRRELIDSGCFAVHHWANSWIHNLSGEFQNPAPETVDGFKFYPMQDSPGMNFFDGGRNIPILAEICRNNTDVVAFNTDGYAKHIICASTEFSEMPNANKNEGLYVKKSFAESAAYLELPVDKTFVDLVKVGPKPFRLYLDDINDPIVSRAIRDAGAWEPVETALVSKLLSQGETVVDIGAHIGYFTVIFSHLVGKHGAVYGFEPEIDNFSLLQANILTNRLQNVTIENLALSSSSGVTHLYLSSDNKGDHRLAPTPGRDEQEITYVTLDQYLSSDSQEIHFVKSDTQGHELEVLLGMAGVIERNKDHLCCLIEFSPGLLAAASPDRVGCLIDYFDSYPAEIYWIREQGQNHELVLMDKAALYDVASIMLKHEDDDHACNILVFFSAKARNKYFSKLGW